MAGGKLEGEKLVTSGGRVLGVTATGNTLKEAVDSAYDAVKQIRFENAYVQKRHRQACASGVNLNGGGLLPPELH